MITLKKAVSLLINEVRMKLQTFIVCSATQTQKHTHDESILGYLASVSWKVVRRLQGEACRTDVPCWHVSYSEREREGKKREGESVSQ